MSDPATAATVRGLADWLGVDVIQTNPHIYALAQDLIRSGRWSVDLHRGLVLRGSKPLGSPNTSGYLRVGFSVSGTGYTALVHRIVWEFAYGPIPQGLFVNHIDGRKTNNRLANLELVDQAGNMKHAYRTGLMAARHGSLCTTAKLTADQAREIYLRSHNGESPTHLAAEYGVQRETVSSIKHRRRWTRATAALAS